ncbi:interleukin-15 isoform X3 [Lampris incognitus]|uniref:interleukin-15 isoform X3 n=1 Tax=Lampris incognitus TaxID=2546036 RepID=UPI0024B5CAC7|nr:interleukin-15 isoform X3 [Lampris incognitus]XP_056136685.1 interleukin-15 isoform X3 [Lampris incognitus]
MKHIFEKDVRFHLSSIHYQRRHNFEVWFAFLILSFLGTSTCATAAPSKSYKTHVLQLCLKKMKHIFEKSDALLYSPSIDDIPENCGIMSLKCYILELVVVLYEEDLLKSDDAECIFHFNATLSSQASSVSCPSCETQTLKSATIFLERMVILLQSLQ